MAEKEERIGIKIEIYDPCGRCTIKDKCAKNIDTQAFLKDPHSCFQYKLLHRLPTKVEAIERMAKALHSRSTVISDMEKDWGKLDESWRDSFCKYAEAALNAIAPMIPQEEEE